MKYFVTKSLPLRFLSLFCTAAILGCFLLAPSYVQAGSSNWVGTVGQKNGMERFIDGFGCIKPTKDGGYIGLGITGMNLTPQTNNDIWVVKFDSDNNVIWSKTYGKDGPDDASSIIEVPDGYVITGTYGGIEKYDPDKVRTEPPIAWVIKIDFNGAIIWNRMLFGDLSKTEPDPHGYFTSANDVIRTKDGNYAVLVGVRGKPYANIGIIKLDSGSGNPIWTQVYEPQLDRSDTWYWGKKIIETLNGNLIVSGLFARNFTYTRQAMVLSLNSEGTFQWMNRYGNSEVLGDWTDFNAIKEVIELDGMGIPKSTGYILTGFAPSTTTAPDGYAIMRIFLVKIDASGNLLMQKVYEDDSYDASGTDIQINGDSFTIAGFAQTIGPMRPIGTKRSALIMKVNKDGSIGMSSFQKLYGGMKSAMANSINKLGNGYLLGGNINGAAYTDVDGFVLNLDENGVTGGSCDAVGDGNFKVRDTSYTSRVITPFNKRVVSGAFFVLNPDKDITSVKEITCAGGGGGAIK